MLQRTTEPAAVPYRPLHLLVEDPQLVLDDLESPFEGIEVTTCGGPQGDDETCPLVMDGSCPLGPADVVVTALDGPWAACVRNAWAETTTPVVDAGDVTATDPTERLRHHVGVALQRIGST